MFRLLASIHVLLLLFVVDLKNNYAENLPINDFSSVELNVAPVATSVQISGNLFLNEILTGTYTFEDADSDAETGSTFKWFRSDDAVATNKTEINGEIGTTYTLTQADVGKFISFEVTPSDGQLFGNPVESSLVGAIVQLPTITASEASSISSTTVQLTATISSNGGDEISEQGFVLSQTANPDSNDTKIIHAINGVGDFSETLSNLLPNRTYFAKAYAINSAGIVYSNEISFTTLKQELTVSGTFSVSDKFYDGTTAATITSNTLELIGIVGSDDVTILEITAEFDNKNVQSSKTVQLSDLTLQGVDAGNYTISFASAPTTTAAILFKEVTVAGTFTVSSKTYDGNRTATVQSELLTINGILAGDDVSISSVSAEFDTKQVGNAKTVSISAINLSGADATNYQISLTNAPTSTADVSIKKIGISGSFTVANKSYDGTKSAQLATNSLLLNGAVAGDDVRLAVNSVEFAQAIPGSGIQVSITDANINGVDASNYQLTLNSAPTSTASISQKELTVVGNFTVSDKLYDAMSTATITNSSFNLNGIIGVEDVQISTVVAIFDSKNAAETKTVSLQTVNLSGSNASNYRVNLDSAPTTTATISKKEISVIGRFSVKQKIYDATVSAEFETDNLDLSGIIAGDNVVISLVSIAFDSPTVGQSKAVSITSATLSGTDANNYEVDLAGSPTSSASIVVKDVTISGSFEVNDKVYDGTTTAVLSSQNLAVNGVISGDEVTIGNITIVFDSEKKGMGKNVTISDIQLIGTDAGNYTVSLLGSPVSTANIIGKPLQITGSFSVSDKNYDGTTTATVIANSLGISGVEAEDSVVLDSVRIRFPEKNAAENSILTLTGTTIFLSGADLANYELDESSFPSDTATIFPVVLQLDSVQVADKEYDGTTDATLLNPGKITGLIGNETVSIATSSLKATFETNTAGAAKNVTIVGYTLLDGQNGGLAQNYSLPNDTVVTTANITQKELIIIANDSTFIYTGVPFFGGNGVIYEAFNANEDSSSLDGNLTYTGTSQGAINPGKYLITPSGFSSVNYAIRFVSDTLTILALPVAQQPNPDTSAINVELTSSVSVGFSVPVTLNKQDSVRVKEDSVYLSGISLNMVNNRLVINGITLLNDRKYTVYIGKGAVISSENVDNAPFEWSFRTIVQRPEIPVLFHPPMDDSLTAISTPFSWSVAARAEMYEWQLSNADNFSSIIQFQQNIADTVLALSTELTPLEVYWWRVRASNFAGFSDWSVPSRFITKAAQPTLLFPDTNQVDVSIAPKFSWSTIHSNVNFRFQLGLDSTFKVLNSDTLILSSEFSVVDLLSDTSYYWRVKVEDSRGESDFTAFRTFRTRKSPNQTESEPISRTFSFGSSSASGDSKTTPQLDDYRMLSLPGSDNIRLDALFGGGYDILWRAFYETGADSAMFVEYSRRDNRFVFAPGRGFWVLSTEPINLNRTLQAVELDSLDRYGIPVHSGWNIIGNPFQKNVSWTQIRALNGIQGDIWGFNGQFARFDSLEAFRGYYFFNDPIFNLDTLFIPYTDIKQRGESLPVATAIPEEIPQLKATAYYPDGAQLDVIWVFAKSSELNLTIDQTHPDLYFVNKGMILTSGKGKSVGKVQSEARYNSSVESYQLEIKANRGSKINWKVDMKNLPADASLLLVNKVSSKNWLVKDNEMIELLITEPTSQYEVYIGSESSLLDLQEQLVPDKIELIQNYPNPFNPSTVIRFSLTEIADVRLEVYDILGRKVATLVNGTVQAGWHSSVFNATDLASGMYLYRLQVGNTIQIKKMLLVK